MDIKSKIILISGPTASGKSKQADKLAKKIGGEIINADSMQVYKELKILTARPSINNKIKYHLYGFLSVKNKFSTGDWLKLTLTKIKQIKEKGKIPILVGGTGLYFKSLVDGLAKIPNIPLKFRNSIRIEHNKIGQKKFYKKLLKIDPKIKNYINPQDTQRTLRAYEIKKFTKISMIDWFKKTKKHFEDKDFVVIDKPAGLAVHGGGSVAFGVIEALREISGISKLELAHRIDRDTSGCLIMCKRRTVLLAIQNAFRERKVKKIYDLYVHGGWSRKKRRVALPLLRYITQSGERRVKVDADGKPSITDFEVEAKKENATHLRASLVTGRTHQIRVHAQVSGHPVLGDTKYAAQINFEKTRLCLHSSRLKFRFGDRDLDVVAPVPQEMRNIWSRIK